METHLLLVPYDTARRDWRSGAGPNHLLQAGLTTHLHSKGHFVADIQVIEDDSTSLPPRFVRLLSLPGGSPRASVSPGLPAGFP
jgi:hypothetical protein